MRVVKKHDIRKNEILDAAETLFYSQGYNKTTINDILKVVEIGKGTFYHYFKAKEEVLDEIINRVIEKDIEMAQAVNEDNTLTAAEKFFKILVTQQPKESNNKVQLLEEIQKANNAEIQQKSLVATIIHLTPILADVVSQGVEQEQFNTPYPTETIEFLLSSFQVIFDDGLFNWTEAAIMTKAQAFVYMMELLLGAEKNSFAYIIDMLNA